MKASLRPRRAITVCLASSGVAPAMNFRAITPADARAAEASHSARSEPCGRQPQAQAEPPGNPITGLAQIFRQVAADRFGGFERRQRVDEPEELDAHQGVVERRSHEPLFPPGTLPGPGTAADPLEQLAADLLRACFKGRG